MSPESINWKKAKRELAQIDDAATKPELTPDIVIRKGAADRTVYFREYWRARARREVPKDLKCRFCKKFYAERKDWRQFDDEMICKYCSATAHRCDRGVRFYVDRMQIVNFISLNPFMTDAGIARMLKSSHRTITKVMQGELQWITRKTYVGFKRGWDGFVFTRNLPHVASPMLKQLRDSAGWTQLQAAEYLGIPLSTYGAIENGMIKIKPGDLDDLMETLKNGSELV